MKRLFFLTLQAFTIILFSCQKEVKWITPENSDSTQNQGMLLDYEILKNGNDSTITKYEYDSKGKLIAITSTSTDPSNNQSAVLRRDTDGLIQSIIFKGWDFVVADSSVLKVYSDKATKRYVASVISFDGAGSTTKDSIIYFYSNNRIVKDSSVTIAGASKIPSQKDEYIYNAAGNLVEQHIYSYDQASSSWQIPLHFVHEYDNKKVPIMLGDEAILLFTPNSASKNNVTKTTSFYANSPGVFPTELFAYTYNALGLPVIINYTSGVTTATYYLFYK